MSLLGSGTIEEQESWKLKSHTDSGPDLVKEPPKEMEDFYKRLEEVAKGKVSTDINLEKKSLRYNSGKLKWSMVHFQSLEPLVRVLEYGAHKYTIYKDKDGKEIKGIDIPIGEKDRYEVVKSGVDNWKKGLDKTQILESMFRHIAAMLDGEENDKESGLPHMGHIMCNAMFYVHESNRK